MLRKEGLMDDAFIKMLMSWQHVSGFNVHNQVRIMPGDERGLENLAQYIIRNAFSLEKLNYYEKNDSVIYHSKMTHGKNKKNFELFSPLECIAAITQHIPDSRFNWYVTMAGIVIECAVIERSSRSRTRTIVVSRAQTIR